MRSFCPTVCVIFSAGDTVPAAGVDSAREQKKLEASLPKVAVAQGKMLDVKLRRLE